jgi:ribosomal protein S17E
VDPPTAIARHLVEHYPDHGFNIDFQEAKEIGLHVTEANPAQQKLMDALAQYLPHMTAIGRVKEVTADGKTKAKKSR